FAMSVLFFNHPPSPDSSSLSLHDALPICSISWPRMPRRRCRARGWLPSSRAASRICGRRRIRCKGIHGDRFGGGRFPDDAAADRSEEHTSELQSLTNLVCRLLLEKKKKTH